MRYAIGAAMLLVMLGLVLESPAQNKGQKAPKKDDDATPQEVKQLAAMREVTAKVESVSGGTLTLRIEYQALAMNNNNSQNRNNNNNNRNRNNPYQQQRRAQQSRNPIQMQQQMQRLVMQAMQQQARQGAGGGMYRVVTEHKDFDLPMGNDVKVRTLYLPTRFDEKGNPKAYTEAEKKELKQPDGNLTGFHAEVADLKPGQVVKVTMDPGKSGPDVEADDRAPHVKMVVILQEAADNGSSRGNQKKK